MYWPLVSLHLIIDICFGLDYKYILPKMEDLKKKFIICFAVTNCVTHGKFDRIQAAPNGSDLASHLLCLTQKSLTFKHSSRTQRKNPGHVRKNLDVWQPYPNSNPNPSTNHIQCTLSERHIASITYTIHQ